MDTRIQIREFLRKNFYLADITPLKDDVSLLSQGIIDSTGVLELIAFLEQAFGVVVLDTETVPANLDSVDGIVAYVQKKQQAAAQESEMSELGPCA